MAYDKEYAKAYREKNREKIRILKREWSHKNKEKCNIATKKYQTKNKERIKEVTKKYREDNAEKIREFNKKYSKRLEVKERENKRKQKKRDTDPIFRLNNSLSFGVLKSLKTNKISKNRRHWENLVGYSKKILKQHLEKQFKKGMTWDNYGEWQIDHIVPLSFFKYNSTNDVEFKYCWSLHNLQPLWKEENYRKNDKITINGKKILAKLYGREV